MGEGWGGGERGGWGRREGGRRRKGRERKEGRGGGRSRRVVVLTTNLYILYHYASVVGVWARDKKEGHALTCGSGGVSASVSVTNSNTRATD